MQSTKIKSALISTYYKDGLEELIHVLADNGVTMYSTGGTRTFIENLGYNVVPVEDITGYPSILGGRVKTLHPKIFGGILAIRNEDHMSQLNEYEIPPLDLVVVDLYPFEETLRSTQNEEEIIEKIDIGGISLIRAAAKNYKDVLIVADKADYSSLTQTLKENNGETTLEIRRKFARKAFHVSSHYDSKIFDYFNSDEDSALDVFKKSESTVLPLRYGENPHQAAAFYGDFEACFEKISGKELSFNNLVDVDAAVDIMRDMRDNKFCFAILKHTNTCGLAVRDSVYEAWKAALECDSTSAFGGILITNAEIDLKTAEAIDEIFYEVLIAPSFTPEAIQLLEKKKNRILLKINDWTSNKKAFKSLLNGVVVQDKDARVETIADFTTATIKTPTQDELENLEFAVVAVKQLKSNTIVLAKNKQLIGMGCGQTSRVDALRQAIEKANQFGFDINGAVMASDAFFPFPDCVEIADKAGITAIVQPGGSIKDKDSIDYCNEHGLAMVLTGVRHFKH